MAPAHKDTGVNINKIVSHVEKNNLLLPNKYKITASLGDKDIWFNCHTITLPGKSLATEEYFRAGPVNKIPYQLINEDFTTVFYVTDDMKVNKEIYDFLDDICGDASGVKYYQEIIGEMNIEIMDRKAKESYTMKIEDCYPTAIASMDLSYGSEAIAEVTVTWACYTFK